MPVAELQANGERPALEKDEHVRGPRVRLIAVTLQLQVVADDGDTLNPLQVQPITVVAKDWETFSLEAQVADLQRQLDEAPT